MSFTNTLTNLFTEHFSLAASVRSQSRSELLLSILKSNFKCFILKTYAYNFYVLTAFCTCLRHVQINFAKKNFKRLVIRLGFLYISPFLSIHVHTHFVHFPFRPLFDSGKINKYNNLKNLQILVLTFHHLVYTSSNIDISNINNLSIP